MTDLSGRVPRERVPSAETSCMLVHTLGPELGFGLGRIGMGLRYGRAWLGLCNIRVELADI